LASQIAMTRLSSLIGSFGLNERLTLSSSDPNNIMYVGQNFERGQYDHTTLIYQNYSTEVKEFR
ncbi:MAG: hypothetical protein ACK457_12245, partial [Flavobacteriia bacterium]